MSDDFEKWRKQIECKNDGFAIELVIYVWIAVIVATILWELFS